MQVQRVDLGEKVICGNCRPDGWRFISPLLFLVWLCQHPTVECLWRHCFILWGSWLGAISISRWPSLQQRVQDSHPQLSWDTAVTSESQLRLNDSFFLQLHDSDSRTFNFWVIVFWSEGKRKINENTFHENCYVHATWLQDFCWALVERFTMVEHWTCFVVVEKFMQDLKEHKKGRIPARRESLYFSSC